MGMRYRETPQFSKKLREALRRLLRAAIVVKHDGNAEKSSLLGDSRDVEVASSNLVAPIVFCGVLECLACLKWLFSTGFENQLGLLDTLLIALPSAARQNP